MITAFIGCSSVGKSTIMSLLYANRSFIYVRNIITRPSRFGEYHKTTITEDDFEKAIKNNELILQNEHFGFRYSYLKSDIDQAISNIRDYYMIDFGIENINQLDKLENTYKIVLIPESIEFLKENIIKSGRTERLDEILASYKSYYSFLEEGYNSNLDALVIKNKKNDQGGVTYKVISYLVNKSESYISSPLLFKNERLKLILENLKSHSSARNGLEAYQLLSNAINEFEDQIWGISNYYPPRSFLNGNKTDRLYTIFPESFFEVSGYSGVMLLLSRQELIFISRYGAIEMQFKDANDKYGEINHFESRRKNVFFEKNDSNGDGVWIDKNK